jgi:hypothetical protein
MKFIKKLKKNNGVSLLDVAVGLIILIMFTGILTTSFYKIYLYNISIRMNAIAVGYCIQIAEDIDQKKYEEVDNSLNDTLKDDYGIPDLYTINLEIENYNKDDPEKQDIIKIVDVEIEYKINNVEKTFGIRKLKIKEP